MYSTKDIVRSQSKKMKVYLCRNRYKRLNNLASVIQTEVFLCVHLSCDSYNLERDSGTSFYEPNLIYYSELIDTMYYYVLYYVIEGRVEGNVISSQSFKFQQFYEVYQAG